MRQPRSEQGYTVSPTMANWWVPPDNEETPELRWPLSVEVYDRMRRQDAQVMSVLRAVTLPIRRTGWAIDPGEASPECAQLVADNLGLPVRGQDAQPLRQRDRFSWSDHLRLSLLALAFGHSFFEQWYWIDDKGYARVKLGWRPPRTISRVHVDSDGGLVYVEQWGGKLMPVSQIVAYVNEREGGNWLGQSLLRPAYKFWLLKDRALRTQSQVVARNGMGVPVYEGAPVPEGMTNVEEIRAWQTQDLAHGSKLAQALRAGDNAGAAIPSGAKLTLNGVTGVLPDADPVIRYYDEQIARAVLAHFLNLGTQTGSWALGSTFADFFTLSLQTVAMQIAEVTNQHVIEDLVDINFGTSEPSPQLVFDEIGSRHEATADAVKSLVLCGALRLDDGIETYLRTTFGLPSFDASTHRPTPTPAQVPTPTQTEGGP